MYVKHWKVGNTETCSKITHKCEGAIGYYIVYSDEEKSVLRLRNNDDYVFYFSRENEARLVADFLNKSSYPLNSIINLAQVEGIGLCQYYSPYLGEY